MSFHDAPLTFNARVDLVLVAVVVRDGQGRAVGNLQKEDFQLFDKGKPQVISQFSVEHSAGQAIKETRSPEAITGEKPTREAAPLARPEHYTAYLFDDVHFEFGDMVRVRDAARGHLASLESTERAAIFSTSGQTMLDFTDDRDKLNAALLDLRPRPIARSRSDCPDLTYYTADLIVNKNDPQALEAAMQEVMACQHLNGREAEQTARMAASMELNAGNHESRVSLSAMQNVIRRISAMPGDRSIILVSPGFFTSYDLQQDKTGIVDRAIQANVIISALDGRGLYTVVPGGDVGKRAYDLNAERVKLGYRSQDAMVQDEVLAELVDGTGGTFFHNSNDLAAGFKSVATRPEYSYMLGFSPQNLQVDSSFHKLKVTLKDPSNLNVQARRGYVAPRQVAKSGKKQIEDALFSRKEMHDLPVELETQVSRVSVQRARIAVLARVDLKQIHFRKVDGRNRNDLTVAAGLFDRNGNYLTGIEETLEMRFKDETVKNKLGSPITVKTSFDVKPGSYVVRLVVRDTEKQRMSAQNGTVDIP